MKKIFNLTVAAVILLAVACGEKERAPLLSVTPGELTFGREGGEATFNVASDSKWIITNGKTSWYESDKNAGEKDATVKVTVSASDQPAARKDTIHLAAGVTTAFVVIKQQAEYEDINTFVTDANLKAALLALFDRDNNGKVSSAEVATAREANLAGKQIANLAGLEYLPALEELNVSNNDLETIDLSKTPFLTSLDCSDNQLTAIDLSLLSDLITLDISGNDWATNHLDISANTSLANLDVTATGILYVQVWSGFTTDRFTATPAGELRFRGAAPPSIAVVSPVVTFNQDDVNVTKNLDVTSNVDWTITDIPSWVNVSVNEGHDNAVVTVTITSANTTYDERSGTLTIAGDGQTATVTVKQPGIPLPPLEVDKKRLEHGAATGTETFSIASDKQYTITKPDGDTWYSLSTNSGSGATVVSLSFEANPNPYARLGYIDVTETGTEIGPDGTNITAIKRLLVRQEGNVTPNDADLLSLYVADAKFYTALKTFNAISKSGAGGEITVGDARAFTGSLSGSGLYNKQISSFVGIEFFENIVQFDPGTTNSNANHNTATVIDLSRNTKLTQVEASRMNELLLLDVSNCPDLTSFKANYTALVELDLTANSKLTLVNCSGGITSSGAADMGQLRKVNLTNCPGITNLQLACNKLTEIDLSQNVNLAGSIYLRRNYFKSLDFSKQSKLTTISIRDNRLETLLLPLQTNSDLSVLTGNTSTYGSDKSFNNLSVIDASTCHHIYSIDWTNLPNLQKIRVPAPPRDNANVNYSPSDVSGLTIEEVSTPATSSY
jgi:hypothetical protein